jgi:hypothetical protein
MITPQEKAEKLVLTYLRLQEPNYNWFHKGLAKQCALIAVDEILSMGIFSSSGDWEMAKPYWEEVKMELEKL